MQQKPATTNSSTRKWNPPKGPGTVARCKVTALMNWSSEGSVGRGTMDWKRRFSASNG